MYKSVYFDTWASVWTSTPSEMDLALISKSEPSVNIVNLAFANPTGTYTKGSLTFANTGKLYFAHSLMHKFTSSITIEFSSYSIT
jgi:hypothetical protein